MSPAKDDHPVLALGYTSSIDAAAQAVFAFDGNASITGTAIAFPAAGATVTLWLAAAAAAGNGVILGYAQQPAGNQGRLWIKNPGNLLVGIGTTATAATNLSCADGAWHHLAVTIAPQDPQTVAIGIYLDGTLAWYGLSALVRAAGLAVAGSGDLVLGQGVAGEPGLVAQMSQFVLWTGVLSDAAILSLMSTRPPAGPPTVIDWALTSAQDAGHVAGGGTFVTSNPALRFRSGRTLTASWTPPTVTGATFDLAIAASDHLYYPLDGARQLAGNDPLAASRRHLPGLAEDGERRRARPLERPRARWRSISASRRRCSRRPDPRLSPPRLAGRRSGRALHDGVPAGQNDPGSALRKPDRHQHRHHHPGAGSGAHLHLHLAGDGRRLDRPRVGGRRRAGHAHRRLDLRPDARGRNALVASWTSTDNAASRYLGVVRVAGTSTPVAALILPGATLAYTVPVTAQEGQVYRARCAAWQPASSDLSRRRQRSPSTSSARRPSAPSPATTTAHPHRALELPEPPLRHRPVRAAALGRGEETTDRRGESGDLALHLHRSGDRARRNVNLRIRAYLANSSGPWSAGVVPNGVPQVNDLAAPVDANGTISASWSSVSTQNPNLAGVTYTVTIYTPNHGALHLAGAERSALTLPKSTSHVQVNTTYTLTVTASATGLTPGPASAPVSVSVWTVSPWPPALPGIVSDPIHVGTAASSMRTSIWP